MPSAAPLLVTVLVPYIESDDPNLAYYSDFSQSHAEYTAAFAALNIDWHWQLVTIEDYRDVLDALAENTDRTHVVFNLCDGDEENGVPGISVVRYLDELGLVYTGANATFYDITTSKIAMKRCFAAGNVPTAPWEDISDGLSIEGVFDRCGTPLIVKPAVSAGSMGITLDSVVHTEEALRAQLEVLRDGYRGWALTGGGVLAERFVAGREFTVFVIGSARHAAARIVYPAVERVFNHTLPPTQQFLSFDRLWEIYERETPMADGAYLWEYAPAPHDLQERLQAVSWDAYVSVDGCGYGRVDLRMDDQTGELFVLEVNAQCGLSEDEDYTSIGAILRYAQVPFHAAVHNIVAEAQRAHLAAHSATVSQNSQPVPA
ncbi:MAG: ATP-grasp domain-containing protein [Gemmatimonadaceae bacterium]|nr:ATP-grasp domain-containing protein [Gemmatimonadaceae bacterium]